MPNSLLWSEKAKYEENPGRDAKESIALRQAHAVLQDLNAWPIWRTRSNQPVESTQFLISLS